MYGAPCVATDVTRRTNMVKTSMSATGVSTAHADPSRACLYLARSSRSARTRSNARAAHSSRSALAGFSPRRNRISGGGRASVVAISPSRLGQRSDGAGLGAWPSNRAGSISALQIGRRLRNRGLDLVRCWLGAQLPSELPEQSGVQLLHAK